MSENWRKQVSLSINFKGTKFNGIGTIAPKENCPRLGLGFGLGLVLGLWGNFPRGGFVLEPNFTNIVVLPVFREI